MHVRADLGHPLSLRSVLPDAQFLGADDIAMAGCTCDSRRVQPGTVFVAVHGPNGDKHAAVSEAIARGCSGIVADRPVPGSGLPICYVPDSREALGRICHAMAGDPSRRLKVVGVTGAGGTTTTSCLIASILTTAGCRVGILGALGCFDGRTVTHTAHTTPLAHEMAKSLVRMVEHGCSHAVVEISGRALEEARTAGMSFDVACFTNAPCRELDGHPAIRRGWEATSRLLKQLTAEGFAVVNADDPASLGYLRLIDGPVLTVGVESEAEITATWIERSASEQTILLSAGSEVMPVRTRMIGVAHVYHCLAAAAVGLAYGIDLPTVVRGLESIDYVPGRLERIECGQPFSVFVDCAGTPRALSACLRALREVVPGRLICVFGACGERDRESRPRVGRAVEAGADLSVITDDNPRDEDPQSILEDILAGLKCPAQAEVIPDRAEAIAWALSQARPGDGVLIAGKGHRSFQIVGGRRRWFDDRQVARQWLYANQVSQRL
jgi:UDP-N-acetylmuramoyl-L-alanyl-D-glutamate--2,6-diaminopimelate ligase